MEYFTRINKVANSRPQINQAGLALKSFDHSLLRFVGEALVRLVILYENLESAISNRLKISN